MQRLVDLLETGGRRQDGGAGDRPAGVLRGSARRTGRASAPSGWRPRPAAGPTWSRPTRRRSTKLAGPDGAAAADDPGPGLRARAGQPRGGDRAQPGGAGAVAQRPRVGAGAGAPVRGHRAARRAAGHLRQEAVDGAQPRPRSARCASSWPASTRTRSAMPARPSRFTRDILQVQPATSCRRCGRWTALYRVDRAVARAGQTRSSASWRWPPIPAERAELMFRLGEVQEKQLGERKPAVESYRDALALDPGHAGARAALEGYLSDKKLQMTAVEALEPIYEKGEDLARLVEVLRIRLEHAKDTGKRVHAAAAGRRAGIGHGPGRGIVRCLRRGVPGGPGVDAGAHGAGGSGRQPRPLGRLVELYSEALAEQEAGARRWSASCCWWWRSATTRSWATARRRWSTSSAPRTSSPRTRRRWRRWSACTPAPSAGPTWSRPCARRPTWSARRAERERIHVQIATLFEEAIGNPDEAITAWKDVLGDNPASVMALRALDRLYQQRGMDTRAGGQPAAAAGADPGRGRHGDVARPPGAPAPGQAGGSAGRGRDLPPPARADRPRTSRPSRPWSASCPRPQQELEVAQMLEPVYRQRNDFPNLVRVLEIEARHAQETRAADRPAAGDRRRLRGRLGRSGQRLRGAGPGAGREPGRHRDPAAAGAAGARAGPAGRPGRPLRGAWSTRSATTR